MVLKILPMSSVSEAQHIERTDNSAADCIQACEKKILTLTSILFIKGLKNALPPICYSCYSQCTHSLDVSSASVSLALLNLETIPLLLGHALFASGLRGKEWGHAIR